jgi:hypothetical protein
VLEAVPRAGRDDRYAFHRRVPVDNELVVRRLGIEAGCGLNAGKIDAIKARRDMRPDQLFFGLVAGGGLWLAPPYLIADI